MQRDNEGFYGIPQDEASALAGIGTWIPGRSLAPRSRLDGSCRDVCKRGLACEFQHLRASLQRGYYALVLIEGLC